MSKYIPESCPFRKNPDPDESEFTKENCSGCEYRCDTASAAEFKRAMAEFKRAVAEAAGPVVRAISELANLFVRYSTTPEALDYAKNTKRRKAHVRTWKRRGPRNGKSKKDR